MVHYVCFQYAVRANVHKERFFYLLHAFSLYGPELTMSVPSTKRVLRISCILVVSVVYVPVSTFKQFLVQQFFCSNGKYVIHHSWCNANMQCEVLIDSVTMKNQIEAVCVGTASMVGPVNRMSLHCSFRARRCGSLRS